uniref:Uncharacterized protein n=1 Tax=Romanomermis culicivorax TaxID=13658 RepID=A0A915KSX1_ROMCU
MPQRLIRNEPLRAQASLPKKVFFEQVARKPKEDVEPIDINEYKTICGKLEKDPIIARLSFSFRRNLFRLPSAAVRLEQHAHFVDEISQLWYKIFCRQLEANRKSMTTNAPFYTPQDLAVTFNSLVKLDKMTNGRLFNKLGDIMCVQKLTDAIFETDLEIGYRLFIFVSFLKQSQFFMEKNSGKNRIFIYYPT